MAKTTDILQELETLGVLSSPVSETSPSLAVASVTTIAQPLLQARDPESSRSLKRAAQLVERLDAFEAVLMDMLTWCNDTKRHISEELGVIPEMEQPEALSNGKPSKRVTVVADELEFESEELAGGPDYELSEAYSESELLEDSEAPGDTDSEVESELEEAGTSSPTVASAASVVLDDDAPVETPASIKAEDADITSDDLKSALKSRTQSPTETASREAAISALKAKFLSPDALVTDSALKDRIPFKDRLRSLVRR